MPERWRMLAVMFVARCALGFQFQAAASTGPTLIAELGISFAELGLLIGMHTAPGILMSLTAALRENPRPTEEAIRDVLGGHLCRCTGYQGMVDAVLAYARAER